MGIIEGTFPPRYRRETKYRNQFVGRRCKRCGKIFYTPRKRCECGSRDIEEIELPREGRIVTRTIVRNPPKGYEKYAPYAIAIIELDVDGQKVRVLGQLTDVDFDKIRTGMRVRATLRRIRAGRRGLIEYGVKRVPVEE